MPMLGQFLLNAGVYNGSMVYSPFPILSNKITSLIGRLFCRNPVSPEMQGNGRGQEKIIDLHGLHVSEAIQVLKRDLTLLRSAARSLEQRLPVYICVGTGHHTRGSRTPARLPIAVQRYLLEEEGIEYSEPQPGLLRIVIY